jgi:hypothetical protein
VTKVETLTSNILKAFGASQTKNPLSRGLSMDLPFEIRAIIAFQMVGGARFECARGAQARSGIALPASGGSRLRLVSVEPFSTLT